jgi:heme A synthase
LKLAFQQSGNYREAGEWYLSEMRCVRKQMVEDGGRWLERAGMFVMEKVAGYGERELRPLAWFLIAAFLFATVQGLLGIRSARDGSVICGLEWPVTVQGLHRAVTCVYLSVVTLTTLGYGDYAPADWPGQIAASTEAVLGFVLLSLFLVCVVRKFSR